MTVRFEMNSMESVTSAFDHAQERTAGPGAEWQQATITGIEALDTHAPEVPARIALTVTAQDGSELVWEGSLPTPLDDDSDSLTSRLIRSTDDAAPSVSSLDGETVWIRHRSPEHEAVPATSERWDRSGQWLLESPADRQRRQGLVHRWGRVLTATVLFLNETLGVWRLVLQIGLLIALAFLIEPAWAIILGGVTILACEEVALIAVRE